MVDKLKKNAAYRVTESFTTPVMEGHEIGGVWSEHSSVALDPGEEFTVVGEAASGGWMVAKMNHPLLFNINTVAEINWKGEFYISPEFSGTKIEEVE